MVLSKVIIIIIHNHSLHISPAHTLLLPTQWNLWHPAPSSILRYLGLHASHLLFTSTFISPCVRAVSKLAYLLSSSLTPSVRIHVSHSWFYLSASFLPCISYIAILRNSIFSQPLSLLTSLPHHTKLSSLSNPMFCTPSHSSEPQTSYTIHSLNSSHPFQGLLY